MGMGYALTEQYEIKEGRPVSRFGTLGLFRADKVSHIESMIIEKTGVEPGYGAIGIGEITSIPTAPVINVCLEPDVVPESGELDVFAGQYQICFTGI